MRITQKLKWQALPHFLFLAFFLSACHETSDIQPFFEEETIASDGLPTNFNVSDFLEILNEIRAEGCICGDEAMEAAGTLNWNSLLSQAAIKHSEDMHANRFLDHIGSDNSTIVSRVEETGYPWRLLGENLARGIFDEASLLEAWKKSDVHCRLMMNKDFLEVGVGRKGEYWTMVLAR
jgi:uncharacterized protein YkwD